MPKSRKIGEPIVTKAVGRGVQIKMFHIEQSEMNRPRLAERRENQL